MNIKKLMKVVKTKQFAIGALVVSVVAASIITAIRSKTEIIIVDDVVTELDD